MVAGVVGDMENTVEEFSKMNHDRTKKIIVYISGTWDLFHIGHLNAIITAKKLGDELIVGVSTDELIRKYKKYDPIYPYKDRLKIIESLKYVDRIVTQEELSTEEQFRALNFDVLVVGDDWKGKYLSGIEWIRKHESKVVIYLPRTPGISTSSIRKRLYANVIK